MKSLTKLTLTTAGVACASAIQAAPLVSLGEGIDLFATGSASIRHETNVLQVPDNKEADTIYIFSPGLQLIAGQSGTTAFSGELSYQHSFLFYTEMSEDDPATAQDEDLNDDQGRLEGSLQISGGAVTYTGHALYYQTQTNSAPSVNANGYVPVGIKRDHITVDNTVEVEVGPKTSVAVGGNYLSLDYDATGYSDYSYWMIPLDLYYELSPKLDASVGYSYRSVDVDVVNRDAKDHMVDVGLRGEILPKLQGQVKVGMISRSIDDDTAADDSDNTLHMAADVNYSATPLLTLVVQGFRDYGVAQTGGTSTVRTGASLAARYSISPVLYATGTLSYSNTDYNSISDTSANVGRTDDFYAMGAQLTYSPNDYFGVWGGYTYLTNESNRNQLDFTNNVFELGVRFSY